MDECRTCRWWTPPEGNWEPIAMPVDPDTHQPMEMPFEVRLCRNPKLMFCERPLEDPGFAVADGSEYMANLYTTPSFGCPLHEERT